MWLCGYVVLLKRVKVYVCIETEVKADDIDSKVMKSAMPALLRRPPCGELKMPPASSLQPCKPPSWLGRKKQCPAAPPFKLQDVHRLKHLTVR
jgi:hypothetical protein